VASLQKVLGKALSIMADASHDNPRAIQALEVCLCGTLTDCVRRLGPSQLAALQPHLRNLLQAAGWLYPCFMPSSRLAPQVMGSAVETWVCCMTLANQILYRNLPTSMTAFQFLAEPRRRPQVPGGFAADQPLSGEASGYCKRQHRAVHIWRACTQHVHILQCPVVAVC
jgi:hypothetical protein